MSDTSMHFHNRQHCRAEKKVLEAKLEATRRMLVDIYDHAVDCPVGRDAEEFIEASRLALAAIQEEEE